MENDGKPKGFEQKKARKRAPSWASEPGQAGDLNVKGHIGAPRAMFSPHAWRPWRWGDEA